jgi:hypothetical protein
MSKGGGQTRTISSTGAPAYAQPYLQYGLEQAKALYESPTPQYYPGSTVVGYSPETEAALSATRQYASQPNPLVSGVQDVVAQNLMGTNPLQAAAFRPVVEQVQGQAAKAGRYGSGYQQAAVAQALAPYAYQAQQAAISQAPAAYKFGLAPADLMLGVGAAKEEQARAELQADIDRFLFEQQKPQQKLAEYMTSVQGGTVGSQQITPQYRQPASSFLGGALTGGQIGTMINPSYAGYGAALGGGLSLLG